MAMETVVGFQFTPEKEAARIITKYAKYVREDEIFDAENAGAIGLFTNEKFALLRKKEWCELPLKMTDRDTLRNLRKQEKILGITRDVVNLLPRQWRNCLSEKSQEELQFALRSTSAVHALLHDIQTEIAEKPQKQFVHPRFMRDVLSECYGLSCGGQIFALMDEAARTFQDTHQDPMVKRYLAVRAHYHQYLRNPESMPEDTSLRVKLCVAIEKYNQSTGENLDLARVAALPMESVTYLAEIYCDDVPLPEVSKTRIFALE